MDNKVILNPFLEGESVVSIAILLASVIENEAMMADFYIQRFNELGGDNAKGQNFYNAQAVKDMAEKSHHTLRVLDLISAKFADLLSQEAREEIRNSLNRLDYNINNRKAG